ncbi:hypothetical protein C0081_02090 [Cohaesibacter celericrescens]|uniref:Uncharacterized protein n=1 Tax=Cohaesibacter celericrescens TaxID=2067669 RepID=A0A2N5XX11_9HYPH|nr:hypothetical protein C0081_02090 [Cohaesibacter celericrescens]
MLFLRPVHVVGSLDASAAKLTIWFLKMLKQKQKARRATKVICIADTSYCQNGTPEKCIQM